MVENEVFPMLADAGKTTYVHTIVGGGDTLADTANGFHAIAQKVNGTSVVLWFNEHSGRSGRRRESRSRRPRRIGRAPESSPAW